MTAEQTEVELQRAYYASMAAQYDDVHLELSEHDVAANMFLALLAAHGPKRMLDIGAGTGRLEALCAALPIGHDVVGLEPSPALREVADEKGLALVDGDATALD